MTPQWISNETIQMSLVGKLPFWNYNLFLFMPPILGAALPTWCVFFILKGNALFDAPFV